MTLAAFAAVLSGCGGSSSTESSSDGSEAETSTEASVSTGDSGDSKLIVATLSFPCGLNGFAQSFCAGLSAGADELPPSFRFEQKSGSDAADVNAYNSLIKTTQQLNPAGIIMFPLGPSVQVPVLKEACGKGIKVLVVDNPIESLGGDCQVSYIAADNKKLGVMGGEWLAKQNPASKEVGILSTPPGQIVSCDDRVEGMEEASEAAGLEIVANETVTELTLEKARSQTTNMLTAHPDLAAVFVCNDEAGGGAATAIKTAGSDVMLISVDGSAEAVERIPDEWSADVSQDPFFAGKEAVLTLAKSLEGKKVPANVTEPSVVVDEANKEEYLQKLEEEVGQ